MSNLSHFSRGPGRPNPLSNPEFALKVAEAFVAGMSRQEMCDLFGLKDKATITRWRRDPRVKAQAFKLIEDRVLAITRKVDAKIEGILSGAGNLTVTELIMIRKEFLGGALRAQTERADEATIGEAQDWLEANPALVEELLTSFDKAGVKAEA